MYRLKTVTMTKQTFEIVTHHNNQTTWEYTSTKRTPEQLKRLRQMAMILAYRILKEDGEITQSEANKAAWTLAKHYENRAIIIDGTTTTGKKLKRVVLDGWHTRNKVKGTGRPMKPGMKLFSDLAKMEVNKPSTISVKLDNIKIY